MIDQGRITAAVVDLLTDVGETTGGDGDARGDLPLDETFGLLKNQRRRRILAYLREHGETASIGEIAEHIAAKENDIDVAQLSSDQRKRVYISLYQGHLPKMDGTGVIAFDKNRGTVELQETSRQVLRYLNTESAPSSGQPRPAIKVGVLLAVPVLLVGGLAANVSIELLLLAGTGAMGTMAAAYLWAHYQRVV